MSKTCKKCGKEIPQDSKKNVCESCRNRKNGKLRKVGESVLGVAVFVGGTALAVLLKDKFGNPKT
jgi:hypothetical protein